MDKYCEIDLESDSDASSEDYVESIVTTSGDTTESLISAPTLYTDSEESIKVYNFLEPPSKFVCLFSNLGYKFIIKRKYTRPSPYLSVCLCRANTIYLPFEPEVLQLLCNYLTYRWWSYNKPGTFSPFLIPADIAVPAATIGTMLGI